MRHIRLPLHACTAVAIVLGPAGLASGQAAPPFLATASAAQHAAPIPRPGSNLGNLTSPTISLRLDRVPLEFALKEISREAGVPITFSVDIIPADLRVSLAADSMPLGEALRSVLSGTALDLLVTGNGVAITRRAPDPWAAPPVSAPTGAPLPSPRRFIPRLALASISVRQQTGTLTGRVFDAATGEPVAGAQVSVVGTPLGAVSDADGRYTIPGVAPGRHRVRINHLGYAARTRSVTLTAGATAELVFELEPTAVVLEGVVAVGYGTQRRQDVTGAVASVDIDEVQTAPVTSVEQLLQGRAAGVQVVRSNGAPGGGISVRIRGTNSITASSEPLYVIDGVPAFVGGSGGRVVSSNPLTDLNPNDIASIEVLKDASSAAIYGARGANGVVLVTTKQGRRGENIVRLQSSYGMQEVARTIPLLNAQQFAEFQNEALVNAGRRPLYTREEIASFGAGTDWQDLVYRTAPVQNHSVAFSGGDEKSRYLVSGDVFDQQGVIRNSSFRRYSLRLNADREMSDRFRLGSRATLSRTSGDQALTDANLNAGVVMSALAFSPISPVRDEDGYVMVNPLSGSIVPNPVATALELTNERTSSRLIGNLFAEADLTDDLTFRTSLGGSAGFVRNEYFAPTNIFEGATRGGEASMTSSEAVQVVNENILTYRRQLRDRDAVDLTAGFTVQNFRGEIFSAGSQQFATNVTRANDLGAGALPLNPSSGLQDWTLLSYLGRANYSIAGKYLFTATGRYDGSSKFGENSKWGFFPSVALGWRVSEESVLQDLDWLSDAKLRLSYGETGNQEISTLASFARLVPVQYLFGTQQVAGYAVAGLAPNPDLKWESTRQLNAGLDMAVWDQRVTISGDIYRSTTDDLLLTVPLPATTGYQSQVRNVGSVRNWGVELGMTSVNVERPTFSWSTTLNVARNRNEVVDLGGLERIVPTNVASQPLEGRTSQIVEPGQPLGAFLGYQTAGIWQLGEEGPGAVAGEWKIVDVNGDGRITADDRTILGDPNPEFYGGITNNFAFGPLTLDVFLQGSYGNEVFNATGVFIKEGVTAANQHVQALERWTPERPSNTVPRAQINRTRHLLDVYIEDGSYLRLENVTLGYRLPDRLIPGADQGRIYVSGQNLWLWTDYSGYDPEVSSFGSEPVLRGVDMGMYPRNRTVNVGLDLTL